MSKRTKKLMEAIVKVNEAIACTDLNGDYVSMTTARQHLKKALQSAIEGDQADRRHRLRLPSNPPKRLA